MSDLDFLNPRRCVWRWGGGGIKLVNGLKKCILT